MKHLEDTPWFICDKEDQNMCAYVDTDSNYFNAEPVLKYLYPDFEDYPNDKKDKLLEDLALKYQDIITDHYDKLAEDCFNIKSHRLEMKTECVIRSAYFRATRRYAQWITKQEGIKKDTLDIKGLEYMKANFPPIFGKFFNNILEQALKGVTQDEILSQIKEFKDKILSGKIPFTKLGNPTSVKKLDKYSGRKPRAGEMFTEIEKGAPAPVRAAIRYNDLLKFWNLDKKHNQITMADKVKWIYLKENPYKIEALAFLDYDMPDKIKEFLEKFADRQKVFESILLNKLEGFFTDLQWSLDLNPAINAFDSFEI
jgi:DNA polymerase elongation subunit (family B)|tara:strand:+ start:1976 stop:2911 length:936 start_codon:yes stop_codon:yes gene_type:complete